MCSCMHEIWPIDYQENHWNCCHRMSDIKAKMHQIRFRLGLHPRPCWELELTVLPQTLAGFKGGLLTADSCRWLVGVFVGWVSSSGVVSPSSSSAERASESSPILSGLYSYHIPTNTWTKLRDNQLEPQPKLGQSMIFHPVCMHSLASSLLTVYVRAGGVV